MDQLIQDLTCPITMELFEDPITVPCCGKTFSRLPLCQHLDSSVNKKCPLCNSALTDFDAVNTAKNSTVSSMIDTLNTINPINTINPQSASQSTTNNNHIWSATLTPVNEENDVAELKLSLDRSLFNVKKSLFIAVVDNSGSMDGNPWLQVRAALTHITAVSRINPLVETVIITYNSVASIVNLNISSESDCYRVIQGLRAGGGTNFAAAFDKIKEVLLKYSDQNQDISVVNIAFLTDGQDNTSTDKQQLITNFKNMLQNVCSNNIMVTVHSVGFSGNCDINMLADLYNAGTHQGTLRYAEPSDPDDLLCSKLQSLFNTVTEKSTVQLSLKFNDQDMNVQLLINESKQGELTIWYRFNSKLETVTVNSDVDTDTLIPVTTLPVNPTLLDKWFNTVVDEISAEILNLIKNKDSLTDNIKQLHCCIIQQKLDAIQRSTSSVSTTLVERTEYLLNQIDSFKAGLAVNVGKLNDMMFSSKFGNIVSNSKTNSSYNPASTSTFTPLNPKPLQIVYKVEKDCVRYSRNNENQQRNSIQEAVMNNPFNRYTNDIFQNLKNATVGDLTYTDTSGNNVFHLIAYCGQSETLEKILQCYSNVNLLSVENNDGETPMTLAIKKQGFWKVINTLLKYNVTIPKDRIKGLEQFAINRGLKTTAEIISNYGDPTADVNLDMSADYVRFQYNKAMTKGLNIDVQNYLNVCLSKQMLDMCKILVKKFNAVPTVHMLNNWCIPPKPDSSDVDLYIKLARFVLNNNKNIINEIDDNGDTPLMNATLKGSLHHVKLFIEKGANIDQQNLLGNTALWLACMKGYPCIVSELLSTGADPNKVNFKGNPPLYSVCQKGPKKIAETLLALGATVDHINKNGDTLILICCRNGQHEILDMMLNYVEPEFVDYKAHIDGFNAILASTEANKPECIKVLHEYGVNLNQKTDDSNEILAGATPLHLAAYYERKEALKTLLSLGSDVNAVDVRGQTPLHIAIIQGNVEVIKMLRGYGANITVKDVWGNAPVTYCRSRDDVKKALLDPCTDILTSIAKKMFSKEEELIAFKLLTENTGVLACMSKKEAVNIVTFDGSTPLTTAVIHSNYNFVKLLLQLGADLTVCNSYGLNSAVWASIIRNPRICNLFKDVQIDGQILERVNVARKQFPHIMFLSPLETPKIITPVVSSDIDKRMECQLDSLYVHGIDIDVNVDADVDVDADVSVKDKMSSSLVRFFTDNNNNTESEDVLMKNLMWNAKISTINVIASSTFNLNPQHVLAISLYTSNSVVCLGSLDKINRSYTRCLCNALKELPVYQGELFTGKFIDTAESRHRFRLGETVMFPTFLSTSTMWRVAVEHITEYNTKKKQGTVYIIKSLTGRHVASYSQFSFDSEVVFLPNTKFTVTNWYRGGDYIVLGQPNIREHTYGVKDDEEIQLMLNSSKSLVIELTEI